MTTEAEAVAYLSEHGCRINNIAPLGLGTLGGGVPDSLEDILDLLDPDNLVELFGEIGGQLTDAIPEEVGEILVDAGFTGYILEMLQPAKNGAQYLRYAYAPTAAEIPQTALNLAKKYIKA